jgi:hypothetical protein
MLVQADTDMRDDVRQYSRARKAYEAILRGEAEPKLKSATGATVKATPVDHWPPVRLRLARCLFELQVSGLLV